jgi:LysM repeat protein/ABC-type branched-subunit amino acid transport system substrate-binding protein
MKTKVYIVIIACFCCFSNIQAQQNQDTLIENGKRFLLHKVERGQTLYGLSKLYNITIEDIIKHNPQTENGIKARENIKIYIGEEKKSVSIPEKAAIQTPDTTQQNIHIVQAGETLYGISKKYNLSISDLEKLNPDLSEKLSIGQHIILPYTVKAPEKQETQLMPPTSKAHKKSSYKVYALIPLYTNNIHRIDTTNIKNIADYDKFKSYDFIQFYEALLLAAEDVTNKNIPITLYVEDINDLNTSKLKEMIQNGSFEDADLIIGPFFSDGFSLLCDYTKNKNITMVNPFAISYDECNARMFKVSASYQYQAEYIAKYISQHYTKAQIILVNNQSQSDIMKTQAYKKGLIAGLKDENQISIKEINYQKDGIGGIQSALNPNYENIIFTFYNGEINITNFIQRMYGLKLTNVTLFAPSFWNEYDNIETEYFMALKTHYVDPFFVDYSNPHVITFIDKFRERYNIEPTLEKFAFQGYDITYYFLNALMEYGKGFGTEINAMELPLLCTQFQFKHKSEQCFENSTVHIYKLKDFKFVNALTDEVEEIITPTIKPK